MDIIIKKIIKILKKLMVCLAYINIIFGCIEVVDVLLNKGGTIPTSLMYICTGGLVIYIFNDHLKKEGKNNDK